MQMITSRLGRGFRHMYLVPAFATLIGLAVMLSSCGGSGSPLQSITVSPSSPAVLVNGTTQFTVSGIKVDGSTTTPSVTWATTDSTIASIDGSGLATGLLPGTTTVTATSGSVIGSTTILVTTSALQSIIVSPNTATISVSGANGNTSEQFTATGFFADGSASNISNSVNWNSSNTTVAVIGANTGVATGFVAGTVNITANAGSVKSNTAILNVIQ